MFGTTSSDTVFILKCGILMLSFPMQIPPLVIFSYVSNHMKIYRKLKECVSGASVINPEEISYLRAGFINSARLGHSLWYP